VHSNMSTKIFDIVNNYSQDENDIARWNKMAEGYGPGYSNFANYIRGEHLEFGLKYDKLATQKSYTNPNYPQYQWYPHDVIFPVAPNTLIDFKLLNEETGNISISSIKNKKIQIKLGQVTHIGVWRTWRKNHVMYYELIELTPCKEVLSNLFGGDDNYGLYSVKLVNKLTTKMKKSEKNCLQMTRNSV